MRQLLATLAAAAFVAGIAFGLNRLSLSPWLAPLPLRLLGISPSLLRLPVLPSVLSSVLPAVLELLVVGGGSSILGSAGPPPVLDCMRKIGTRE